MKELLSLYNQRKSEIKQRIEEFSEVWNRNDKEIFKELCFCLLTPQSKAVICDKAIQYLYKTDLLYKGTEEQIREKLINVRFPENKAKYIILAREMFRENGSIKIKDKINPDDIVGTREWLVKNVKGMGYKESSHFLRNIGFGNEIAILDRHIIKNMILMKLIDEMPTTLTKNKYLELEKKLKQFSSFIGIPMAELDLLFWSKETGFVFK